MGEMDGNEITRTPTNPTLKSAALRRSVF